MTDSPRTETEEPIVRSSEYSLAYQKLLEKASNQDPETTLHACVVDETGMDFLDLPSGKTLPYDIKIFDSQDHDTRREAFECSEVLYKEYYRESGSDGIIRVFELHRGKVRRLAIFWCHGHYESDDFIREHVERDRTYHFDLGDNHLSGTIRFPDCRIQIANVRRGYLSDFTRVPIVDMQVKVTGTLCPPRSHCWPNCDFNGRITLPVLLRMRGTHVDPRYRVFIRPWLLELPRWPYGPMFDAQGRRRSLYCDLKERWPSFRDKSLLKGLNLPFQRSILEWMLRITHDRHIGLYAPTLSARDLQT